MSRSAVLLGLLICVVAAEYPAASPYPAAKYPPAGAPDPGQGSGAAPTGPSGPGPSGAGPSGPGPSGPGPFGPGPSGPGPAWPGPFPWGGPGPLPFGPSGPGPWPFGPWGPSGPGPYPLGPYGPHFGPPGSVCAALERLRARAIRVTRPLVAGGVGAGLLWLAKQIIIPNIAVFATAFRRRMGFEDDSPLDRMASEVSRGITNGACMEKVACTLGKATARNYPTARHIARVIDPKTTGFLENFTSAYQRYVLGDESDCQALKCPTY